MPKAYFARPYCNYGTTTDDRDINTIKGLGYEVVDPNNAVLQARYKLEGMQAFLEEVRQCQLLVFRAFSDGSIGAGVGKEIAEAVSKGIPVIEIPSSIFARILTVEQTRAKLEEIKTNSYKRYTGQSDPVR